MEILIVEDERIAANRLEKLVSEYQSGITVLGKFDSVGRTVKWLQQNPPPDLIFLDIQLADGLSFEIFEQVEVKTPIIFTTAYDEYAIRAFKVNSIDYLLKPIDPTGLKAAMDKFGEIFGKEKPQGHTQSYHRLERALQMMVQKYKERFVVKVGERLKTIPTEEVSFFFSWEKATFLQTGRQKFAIDFALDQLEELLDPNQFFRVNRKFLVKLSSIKDIIAYSNSRLKIILDNFDTEDVIVSREKVQDFKKWLDK